MPISKRDFDIGPEMSEEVAGRVNKLLDDLVNHANDSIIRKSFKTKSPGVANTEFQILHGLDRVPTSFLIVSKDKACQVYKSGRAWTKTAAYLKCDQTSVNLEVIVW